MLKIKLKFNLHGPLSRLESQKGRYSYARISEISDISRQGVRRLLTEETQQLDVTTLSKLLTFFATEGMPITVNDLFVIEDNPPTHPHHS